MATVITVPYTIWADEGITEAWPTDGPTARVIFKCLWDDHYQLIHDLMWSSQKVGSAIVRTYPYAYPPSPNLLCRSIESVRPIGHPYPIPSLGLPWLTRKYALVTATFGILTFDATTYTSVTLDHSGEFLTVPDTTYKFSDGTVTNTPIGIMIPQVQINYTRHWMPYLPVAEMLAIVGMVNDAPFPIGNAASAAGTLLFAGGPSEIQADTLGNLTQEVTYRFVYRPVPWNYALHPDGTTGFAPIADGNGNPPYATGDFTTLP